MSMNGMNVDFFDYDIDVHDELVNVLEYPKEYCIDEWIEKVFATIREGAIMCEMKLVDDVTEDIQEFAITDATGRKFVILCFYYLDVNYGYNNDPLYDNFYKSPFYLWKGEKYNAFKRLLQLKLRI